MNPGAATEIRGTIETVAAARGKRRAAKARSALSGRDYVTPDDLKAVFVPVLRHRVALDPAEEIEGVEADAVLRRILDSVEVPR